MEEIKNLFEIVGHRKIACYIIIFSIFVAFVEFIGLALVVPYISLAVNQVVPDNKYVAWLIDLLNIQGYREFMTYASIFIVCFYLFRLIVNLFYNYISLRFVNKLRHIVMTKLFNHYAHIDYAHFVSTNSSDLKKTLLQESRNTQAILKSMIDMIAEFFVLIFLIGLIVYVDWLLAVVLVSIFGAMFYSVTFLIRAKINVLADERIEYSKGVHRYVDEALNNFKFTKLMGAEALNKEGFEQNSYGLYRGNTLFHAINQSPRFILETFGLIFIAAVTYYLVQTNSSESLIATLGVYAVAFYRALPSLNKIIASYNNFQYFKNTIDQIRQDLKIKKEAYQSIEEITFKRKIELSNVAFKYQGADDFLFDGLSLEINKGDKVAVVGKSGCGKSTFVDIVMGMLKPERGHIVVDGRNINDRNMKSWRNKFGYIPQEIYLYDATVADNVTFGRDYDEVRVIEVLKQANIYDFLQTKEGIETMVGEGGIQLSGGQKQRIGIARALYDDPEILVLDEATSALDNETEALIMDEIYQLSEDRTLIIIAHRLSTVEKCTQKITLENH